MAYERKLLYGMLTALKDIGVAKNYLKEDEIKILNNLVSGYFDLAEINAIEHKPMYMADYVEQLDSILSSGNRKILVASGKVSHDQAMKKAKRQRFICWFCVNFGIMCNRMQRENSLSFLGDANLK